MTTIKLQEWMHVGMSENLHSTILTDHNYEG